MDREPVADHAATDRDRLGQRGTSRSRKRPVIEWNRRGDFREVLAEACDLAKPCHAGKRHRHTSFKRLFKPHSIASRQPILAGLDSGGGTADTPMKSPFLEVTMSSTLPTVIDPATLVTPRRRILGMSAVLLPFRADGSFDLDGFIANVARTAAAGIVPAVNMDTGYVHLLDDSQRQQLLALARQTLGDTNDLPYGGLVAGACVVDEPGAGFDEAGYAKQMEMITAVGATPVIFPSFGLAAGGDADVIAGYQAIARRVSQFIGFELSTEFVASGRLLSLDAYAELLAISECTGAKH